MPKRLTVDEVHALAKSILMKHGCSDGHADAVADTVASAERDHAHSHGLFRIPGYVDALKSGSVDGDAVPEIKELTPAIVQVDGKNCFAPLALNAGKDALVAAVKNIGIAAMPLVRVHHFAALWKETEMFAEEGLIAMAFTAYMPTVAPAGGSKPLYGTNPMSFAWPRENALPMVFDQASAAMAKGEVMLADRDGQALPDGVGITSDGTPTNDPGEVLDGGCILPFGGYKGASIALMIELLVGPLIGETTSPETHRRYGSVSGPPQGGELVIAMDPSKFGAASTWAGDAETLFDDLHAIDGARLPGARRQSHREDALETGVDVNDGLMDTLKALAA